jgi:DNA-binding transcriptional LysR family regulator
MPMLVSMGARYGRAEPLSRSARDWFRCTICIGYIARAMVELRDLRAFEMLAAELHFGRAALRLGVSQPTVSRSVRRLEHELGVVLAHRTSRTVRLTEAGHELAGALPGALRQLERTLAAARAMAQGGWEI